MAYELETQAPPISSDIKPLSTIVIVDNHNLNRQCLTHALARFSDATFRAVDNIYAYFGNAAEDVPTRPDAIIQCIAHGQALPTNLGELVPTEYRTVPVIVLSNERMPSQVFELLNTGVRGFLPTSVTLEVAVQALRLVLAGGTFVPASCLRALPEPTSKRDRGALFTERQMQVVEALRLGKPNKLIAYELNMCESTVKVHVRAIMKKLKARNRTEAAYIFSAVSEWRNADKPKSSSPERN